MHDVISKTLPPDPLRVELDRMAAKWTPGACSEAGKLLFGNTSGEWTLESLAKVDEHLQTVAAMRQNSAMLERDEPKAAPAPVAEDPLAEFIERLDELIEFTSNDAINAGRFNPSLQGPNEPDVAGMDSHYAAVIRTVRKLLAPTSTVEKINIAPDNGLLTSHNPDRRGAL